MVKFLALKGEELKKNIIRYILQKILQQALNKQGLLQDFLRRGSAE